MILINLTSKKELRRAQNRAIKRRTRSTTQGKHLSIESRRRYRNSEGSRARIREKREWLYDQKRKPCADCGNTFPPCCMDFDHRPGEKKLDKVGQLVQRAKKVILTEIAKYDLVCANCHRIRTYTRGRAARS